MCLEKFEFLQFGPSLSFGNFGLVTQRELPEAIRMDTRPLFALADAAMQGSLPVRQQQRQSLLRLLGPLLGSAGLASGLWIFARRRKAKPAAKDQSDASSEKSKSKKVAVNNQFFKNLRVLLRICIPSWRYPFASSNISPARKPVCFCSHTPPF